MLAVCRACQNLPARPKRTPRPGPLGQHDCGVLHKSSGGAVLGRLFVLVERLLEWAQLNLRSLKAAHVPGKLNQGANMFSRSKVPSEEWMLHPQMVQKIWEIFGRGGSRPLRLKREFSLPNLLFQGRVGPRLAQPPSLSFSPDRSEPVGNQANQGTGTQVLLVAPLWMNQHWLAELPQLLIAAPWPIPLRRDLLSQANRTIWHPRPELWALHLWPLDGSLHASQSVF